MLETASTTGSAKAALADVNSKTRLQGWSAEKRTYTSTVVAPPHDHGVKVT